MSYDLSVWTVEPVDLEALLKEDGFVGEPGGCSREGKGWGLHVSSDPVEAEDVPDDVFTRLRKIRHLISITLEPIGAPQTAHTLARRTAREIAEAGIGCVEDPQTGKVTLSSAARARQEARDEAAAPSLVKRLFKRKSLADPERVAELDMTFWFDHRRFAERDGLLTLISKMARHLPDALPRRYGPYEPPSFKYAETGPEHFADFLLGETFAVVYPTRPCMSANYPCGEETIGWVTQGPRQRYRAGDLSLGFNARQLDHPDWRDMIRGAWRALAEVTEPFYGEVRLLGGRIAGRATLFFDGKSEQHPVAGPWWRGVPTDPAVARVIGPPYTAKWEPEGAVRIGPLLFLESADWREADAHVNRVPMPLQQPEHGGKGENLHDVYPAEFPFPRPDA